MLKKGGFCLKKTFLAALLLAASLSAPSVDAHTHLLSTNPANGTEVTTELSSISLTYDDQIEEGSFFTVTSSEGQNMNVETFTVEDRMLTGSFAQPLANDSYIVAWTSISKDGHPQTGKFSFTVNVHTDEQSNSSTEQTEEQVEQATVQNEPTEKSTSPNIVFIALGILAAIIITSLIILLKRKK